MPATVPTSDEFDALKGDLEAEKDRRAAMWDAQAQHDVDTAANIATAFAEVRQRLAALEVAEPPPPNTLPLVTPIWGQNIAKMWGTNTKFRYRSGRYTDNQAAVLDLLDELDVSHVRERYVPGNSQQAAALVALAERGIQLVGALGVFGGSSNTNNLDNLAAAVKKHPDWFACVAGFNEPNNTPRPNNWLAITADHQKGIWDHLGGIVEVVGPAFKDNEPTMPADYAAAAQSNIGQYMDKADFHRYPRGTNPTNGMVERRDMALAMADGKGVVCSEGGYNTSPPGAGGGNRVTKAEQAVYAPRHLLEMYLAGVSRFTQYELLDQNTGGSWEKNWGLVETTDNNPNHWVKKPAFFAMANLLDTLSDPGPLYTPEPVPMRVTADPEVKQILVQRRNGHTELLLWLDEPAGSSKRLAVRVETPGQDRTVQVGPGIVGVVA